MILEFTGTVLILSYLTTPHSYGRTHMATELRPFLSRLLLQVVTVLITLGSSAHFFKISSAC
uniref:Uncharacterized protein n=1 Tax=Arundo donax TaxID=35708 RepID=A0A0A8ZJ86_ARUDO